MLHCFVLLRGGQPSLRQLEQQRAMLWIIFLLSGTPTVVREELTQSALGAPLGHIVFRHACKMGLEGIVSKRLGSRYTSRLLKDWLKFKNPEAPAVKRGGGGGLGPGRWTQRRGECVVGAVLSFERERELIFPRRPSEVERLLDQRVDRDAAYGAWTQRLSATEYAVEVKWSGGADAAWSDQSEADMPRTRSGV